MKINYKNPLSAIYDLIREGDYNTLSDALNMTYNAKGRSASEKSALVFGYSILADIYDGQGNPVDALQAYDRARQMFPSDKGLLENEIDFINEFIEKNTNKVTEKDIDQVGVMIKLIKIKVPKSSIIVADSICEPLLNRLERLKSDAQLKEISNIYQVSEPMMYNLYSDLTDKERNDLLIKKIHQTIIEIEKSERLKKKKTKVSPKSKN